MTIFAPIFLSVALFSASAEAASLSGVSVNNDTASAYDATTATNIIIYGGYTPNFGECPATNGTVTSVCNSCTGMTDLCTPTGTRCTYRSVHPSLYLTLTFTPDSIPTGGEVLVLMEGSTGTNDITQNADVIISGIPTAPTANAQVIVKIKWSLICSAATGGQSCDDADQTFSKKLQIGISSAAGADDFASGLSQQFTVNFRHASTNPGVLTTCASGDPFCKFSVTPGDSKVYVENLERGSIASTFNTKWQSVRVFHAQYNGNPANFCAIPLGSSAQFDDLTVPDKTNVSVSGMKNLATNNLQNEVTYMFNIATVDEATVVSGFIDPTLLNATEHTATPGEVVGLLNNKSCFIATAAYGSPMDPHVDLLRKFRNQFLLPSELGRSFVKSYYKISPPVAAFIAEHETLRTLVRWTLWPIILFVQSCASFGAIPSFVGLVFVVFGLIFMLRLSRRKAGEA